MKEKITGCLGKLVLLLRVRFSVKNNGDTPVALFPQDFYVTDNKINQYAPMLEAESIKVLIQSLNPGVSADVTLSFQIPTSAKGLSLNLEDARVNLGQ